MAKKEKKLTQKELKEAVKFSDKELKFINHIAEHTFHGKKHRPYVYVAICCAILENLQLKSDGQLDKETLMKIVDLGTEDLTLEKQMELADKETAKEDGKIFGECESCGMHTVLVKEVGLCGPCCFGEADTINGNW